MNLIMINTQFNKKFLVYFLKDGMDEVCLLRHVELEKLILWDGILKCLNIIKYLYLHL